MIPLAPHVVAFLREALAHQRGASQHTCDSYACSFQLLFEFAAQRLKASPSSLALEHLDAGMISAFLEYLEDARHNSPQTRNVRLAAIRSFFHFLEHREPVMLEQVQRVLGIPYKKTDSRLVPSKAQSLQREIEHRTGHRCAATHRCPLIATRRDSCGPDHLPV